ncbi:hypothetical protein QAD02_015968 [Eretmocerus hayati]|uniref:Uncharacterized protein n=1 Tax=Eretmocerus hayati TaxID=131215 RepID=A0ACC2P9Q0_9HYME|nr:hypothetical protein QAD02_015968 [Eretmocerus hayati]
MDLPATQAMDDYDDVPATQKLSDEDEENTLVGTLSIGDKSYSIVSGKTTIGRHPDSTIQTNHETVSKHHAAIEATSATGPIFIKDLNSSNRTKLNNSRLKPNCMYQIKDGDVLTFGQVVATFKVCTTFDDSVTPSFPRVNHAVKSVIPGTPDSSMDASYNSVGDVSAIPGTQTDDTGTCFRRPKIPDVASISNDSFKLNLSDAPSPSSRNQIRQNDLSEAETRRMSSSESRDELEDDLFDMETQKPASHEASDSNENILDMETQRPLDDNIHNLETQRCNSRRTEIVRGSKNLLLSSARTRQSLPAVRDHRNLEECNTQRFSVPLDGSLMEKRDASVCNAETSNCKSSDSTHNNISDAETQSFIHESSISNKQLVHEQVGPGQISDFSEELDDESFCNLETRNFEDGLSKQKSVDDKIYDCVTPKDLPEELFSEDFDSVETQRFDMNQSKLHCSKSIDSSIYDAQTQPNTPANLDRLSKNIAPRKSDCRKTMNESCQSTDISIYSAETQKIVPKALHNEPMSDLETQRFDPELAEDEESFEDMETQAFGPTEPTHTLEKSYDESIHDAETQKLTSTPAKSYKSSSATPINSKKSDNFLMPSSSPSLKRLSTRSLHLSPCSKKGSEMRADLEDRSVEDSETQKYDAEYRKSLVGAGNEPCTNPGQESLIKNEDDLEHSADQFMNDLETQKFCEAESKDVSLASVGRRSSTISCTTAEISVKESHHENIQNSEIQKFSNSSSEKSSQISESRHILSDVMAESVVLTENASIEDLETQSYVNKESNEFAKPSLNRKSNAHQQSTRSLSMGKRSSTISSAETSHPTDLSFDEIETQKFDEEEARKSNISSTPRKSVCMVKQIEGAEAIVQPIEEVQAQITESSTLDQHNQSKRESLNPSNSLLHTEHISNLEDDGSLQDLETQELCDERPSTIIDETTDDIDTQGASFSIQDMETMPFFNETLSVDNSIKNQTARNSGIAVSHVDRNEIDNIKEEHGEKSDPTTGEVAELQLEHETPQNSNSTHDISSEVKNVPSDDDDEDMFLSQDLLEDCRMEYIVSAGKRTAEDTDLSGKVSDCGVSVSIDGNVALRTDDLSKLSSSKKQEYEKGEDSSTGEEGVLSSHLSRDDNQLNDQTGNVGTEENCDSLMKKDAPQKNLSLLNESCAKVTLRPSRTVLDSSESTAEGVFSDSILRQKKDEDEMVNQANTAKVESATVPVDDESTTDDELFEDDFVSRCSNLSSHRISNSIENQPGFETGFTPDKMNPTLQGKSEFADTEILESLIEDKPSNVDEDDEFIAPSQVTDQRKSQILDSADMYDAPTQIVPKQNVDERNGGECQSTLDNSTDSLEPTQITGKETNTSQGDVKDTLTPSKRSLEELEACNNKRFRNSDVPGNSMVDLNSTVEKNLDEMFEGPDEKVPENESVLLTQQLANILESSQTESDSQVNQTLMSVSPTLGSRRSRARTKSRKTLTGETNSGTPKSNPNLNDTVEKNLNEIFQNSVNNIEEYESDGLMTQQLANILSSQDDNQSLHVEPIDPHGDLTPTSANAHRRGRSSLALRKSSAATPQRQSTSRKSVLLDKLNHSQCQASLEETVEGEGTQNYTASGSNDEHGVLERSHSDGQMVKHSRKSIAYRHATVGFLSDLSPITTSEKVGFDMTKGRTFSSDSQSDGEDIQTAVKKRFNLSLAKSVNLNSSMSSLSDKDERIGRASTSQSAKSKTGNGEDQHLVEESTEKKAMKKRSSRGTRGFSSTFEPVDGSDNVSAYSTESEDNQSPRKKGNEVSSARKSFSSASSTMTSRTSGQTNNLSRRSVALQDDAQNQLPKRTKLTRDDELFKKLSSPASQLHKDKRAVGTTPKALAVMDARDDETCKSNLRGQGRRVASGNKRKNENLDVPSNNSSKENLEVDSDSDSSVKRAKTRTNETKQNASSLSTIESKKIHRSPNEDVRTKRGRPRKDQSLNGSLNLSNVTGTENLTSQGVQKKKLGRPRKDQSLNNSLNISNVSGPENSPSQGTQKKKLGRPKKDQSLNNSLNLSNVTDTNNSPSQGVRKKLGRPRKVQTDVDGAVDQSNVELNKSEKSNQELVKGRGRLRKDSSRDESVDKKEGGNMRITSKSKISKATETLTQVSRMSCVSGRTRTRGVKAQGDEMKIESVKSGAKVSRNRANTSSSTALKRTTQKNQIKNIEVKKDVEEKNNTIVLDDDSGSEAEFCLNKDKKSRNSKEEKESQVETVRSSSSSRAKLTKTTEVESSVRSTRRKRGIHESSVGSKESQNCIVETKNKRIKGAEESSESQEETIPKGTRSRPAKSTKSSRTVNTVETSKSIKSSRGRVRNPSTSSVQSEDNEQDSIRDQICPVKIQKAQPVRQTRKRAASPVEIIESSSEESQEVAEIMQKTVEEDDRSSRARAGRVSKKDDDTKASGTSKKSDETDMEFQKPVGRPKRGKQVLSSSNKSLLNQPTATNESTEFSSSVRSTRGKKVKSSTSPSATVSSREEEIPDPQKILYLGGQTKVRQFIKKLDGVETEDPTECSIVVSDEVQKTFEFLYPLQQGVPIVSCKWLEDSNKAKRFIDWKDYVLKDLKHESQCGFDLQKSLQKAGLKILDGYTLYLTPTIKKPTVAQMKELVSLCGGRSIVRAPTRWSAKTLVIVDAGDLESSKKLLARAPKTVKVYSTELILTGILCQNIDLNEHKIIL